MRNRFSTAARLSAFIAILITPFCRADENTKKVRKVVIVFKTHFDIGYTDLASNVIQRYRTAMIDQALEVCDQSRDLPARQQFVWTLPGWPLKKIMEDWTGQTPERKSRILKAFREGRFVSHALAFTTHTETLEVEDLVRGMSFASRFSRDTGCTLPRDAKMTDVPCHSWVMPTMLKHAGVDFLHLGCNPASSSPRIPLLFWWEGPDGSRLLTMYSSAGYGTGLTPPGEWPFKTWLALVHTGDNHGPPKPGKVKAIIDRAQRALPGAAIQIGRLSDFADEIIREKIELPVVRGDMPDTWIHGPMCDPAGAALARNIRPALSAAESLSTLLGNWGVSVPDVKDTIASAYENSLLYGEHTWGGALYWITSYSPGNIRYGYGDAFRADLEKGRFKRLEQSWNEHTAYIENTRDMIAPLLASELKLLAESVDISGRRVVVFNPLPWKRDGIATFSCDNNKIAALKPVDGSTAVPCEVSGSTVRFLARSIPPMGYRTFVPAVSSAANTSLKTDEQAMTIESPRFKAAFDPERGSISSLVDKSSGRELVDSSGPYRFGQYLYERFDGDQVKAYVKAYTKIKTAWAVNELGKPVMPPAEEVPYRKATPDNCRIRFEKSPLSVTAVMEHSPDRDLPHPVTTRLTLYRDLPYADLEITLHNKPKAAWPEAGWLCLPFKVDRPAFRIGRLASIVDPSRDFVPGSNHDLMWLNSGLTVTNAQGCGAGICPLDHALISLERPGCWKYSIDFVPGKPRVFINLFNNQWTTNFRLYNGGTWTSRVRIWAVDRYRPEQSLVTPSWEARFPLLSSFVDTQAGRLPVSRSGIEVFQRGVLVTAFGPNPDGAGLLLRLWELAGRSGSCEVQLPAGMRPGQIQPIDLRGRNSGTPVPVRDGRFTFKARGFAPASFLISKSPEAHDPAVRE